MTGNLLASAADWFKARETRIRAWAEDENGRYAFAVRVDGRKFWVAAKKYLHGDQASFMDKLVRRAADQDAYLLLFVFEGGHRLVFDPERVQELGEPSNPNESKRASNGEDWLDAPRDWAVDFQRWYDQGDQPEPMMAADGSGERPARPHDITAWGSDR